MASALERKFRSVGTQVRWWGMVGYSGISGRCFDSNTGGKWWCSNRSVVVDNDAARHHRPICIQAIVCRSKLVNEYPGETRLECIDQPETRII